MRNTVTHDHPLWSKFMRGVIPVMSSFSLPANRSYGDGDSNGDGDGDGDTV
jgi:hypothetical protein